MATCSPLSRMIPVLEVRKPPKYTSILRINAENREPDLREAMRLNRMRKVTIAPMGFRPRPENGSCIRRSNAAPSSVSGSPTWARCPELTQRGRTTPSEVPRVRYWAVVALSDGLFPSAIAIPSRKSLR